MDLANLDKAVGMAHARQLLNEADVKGLWNADRTRADCSR
jgi:hypothetical protein